jgi:hypothetical protein
VFFIGVISLMEDKMASIPCKSNGNDKEFETQNESIYVTHATGLGVRKTSDSFPIDFDLSNTK